MCQAKEPTFQPFCELQVDISDKKQIVPDTVQGAINNFFTKHGVSRKCPNPKCGHSNSTSMYSIHKEPLILIVQIKR